jgi:hypothetical protein
MERTCYGNVMKKRKYVEKKLVLYEFIHTIFIYVSKGTKLHFVN